MPREENFDVRADQLARRRLALLRNVCPSCDRGQIHAACTCPETEREIEQIEAELRNIRGM